VNFQLLPKFSDSSTPENSLALNQFLLVAYVLDLLAQQSVSHVGLEPELEPSGFHYFADNYFANFVLAVNDYSFS